CEESRKQPEKWSPFDASAVASGNRHVADRRGPNEDGTGEPGLVGSEIAEGVGGGVDTAPEDQMRRGALVSAQHGAALSRFVGKAQSLSGSLLGNRHTTTPIRDVRELYIAEFSLHGNGN